MTFPLSNTARHAKRALPNLSGHRTGEESDSYPNVVARLGDDWRVIVCRDGIQWIVQRRAGKRHGGARWEARSYCRSRNGLFRACRDFLGEYAHAAMAALTFLPDHIEHGRKS